MKILWNMAGAIAVLSCGVAIAETTAPVLPGNSQTVRVKKPTRHESPAGELRRRSTPPPDPARGHVVRKRCRQSSGA